MYITPNTNIKLLKNSPCEPNYEHTLYFGSKGAQSSYFASLTKYNLTNYTYRRVNQNTIKVDIPCDNLYDVNYMMFQNTSYGNKWFYAFVTSVNYVNDNCTEIIYEIDVMQTWLVGSGNDYTINMCFVEREHTVTDEKYEHLVDENIDYGLHNSVAKHEYNWGAMNICALTSKARSGDDFVPPTGKTINNVYTALNVIAGIPVSDPTSINAYLQHFVEAGQEDSIVALYQYPAKLGDATTTTPFQQEYDASYTPSTIDGYTPKNNKLFNYPYNYIVLSNNNGETADFKYELFENPSSNKFQMTGVFIPQVTTMCYPKNYRGITDDYDSGLVLSNFPTACFVGNAFNEWWGTHKNSVVTGLISTALSSVRVGGTPSIGENVGTLSVTPGLPLVNRTLGLIGTAEDLKLTPPQVHGQVQCESLNAGISRYKYTFYHMQIKAEFARIIDNFFDLYGYACRRVKIPNINSRPHWNYVKTAGCTINGSIPADDERKICDIYDKGITFWKNASEVGNYSLNNSPT